jgi:hypothetical protein
VIKLRDASVTFPKLYVMLIDEVLGVLLGGFVI